MKPETFGKFPRRLQDSGYRIQDMHAQQKRWLRGVGTLVGSIIGAGVFGLPFAFAQSGFFVGALQLALIGAVMIVLFLMYGEITVQTEGRHRFVTYMTKYVGKEVKWFAAALFVASVTGAMVAYIILGGGFISGAVEIATGQTGNTLFYSFLTAAIAAIFIRSGLKFVSRIEVWVVVGILILYGVLIGASIPAIEVENITRVGNSFADYLLPYGVVLFAMAGLGAVPEVHDVLRWHKPLPSVIITGLLIIILLYGLFSFAVVGATGPATTQDVITGLAQVIDPRLAFLGMVLGAVSILSIFTLLGLQLMDTLEIDYKMNKNLAWGLTVGTPFFLFLIGVREFIDVLGFVGSFFGGTMGLLVVVAYEKLKRSPVCARGHKCWRVPTWVSVIVALVFVSGMVAKVLNIVL